jgi:hypothetical protein
MMVLYTPSRQSSPSLANISLETLKLNQNTNPDLMPLPWALPIVKIAGNNALGHGLYPR